MKKLTVLLVMTVAICMIGIGVSVATDKGPAEMVLESTVDPAKKPKPAVFPHGEHQASLTCADCHHAKSDDGKRVDYTDGQKIEKCESCHNKAAGMSKKLATYKGAAHAMCKKCHASNSKDLAKCGVCHPKKK